MVLKEKPARNVLGAMAKYNGGLHVVAYLGRQVHAVPIDQAGEESSLWKSLGEDDRKRLAVWLADYRAGKFAAEISPVSDVGW